MSAPIYRDEAFEGCDFFLDGAVVIASDTSDDGVLVTTSDISGSAISLDVFELGNATAIYSTTVPKVDVIDNTPIPWRLDSIGRNFRYHVDIEALDLASVTLKGGRTYQFIFRVPTATDGTLRGVYEPTIVPLPV